MPSTFKPALRFAFLTAVYDPVVKLTTRESLFKRLLLDQANIRADEKVLDVGCGTGTLMIAASEDVPGANIVGLDADARILDIARAKAKRCGSQLQFSQSLSTSMPFANSSFDKALSTLFFHHLATDAKSSTLKEIYRVLVPGGQLHVADWGEPASRLSRMAFYSVQLFDGFDTTADSVAGKLPSLFAEAGFSQVQSTAAVQTMYGTLSLYRAEKPCAAAQQELCQEAH